MTAPHRSGRADFPHPAPRNTASLHAIRWRSVEMVPDPDVSAIFPSNGPVSRLSPSLRRVPWSRFPRLNGTPGELRLPAAHPATLRLLALRYHPSSRVKPTGPPRFLGSPSYKHAPLSDPGGPTSPRLYRTGRYCLPYLELRRPHNGVTFEAQSRGLLARCLRFAGQATPTQRKTRYRPAGWALVGWDLTPAELSRSLTHWSPSLIFKETSTTSFPSSQASPGALKG